jgi:hypothetical protein
MKKALTDVQHATAKVLNEDQHQGTDAGSVPLKQAAHWLATTPQRQHPNPIIPYLRKAYGLSVKEACGAIREANLIKARAH